jgi:glycosyltransferase involved in cell wall biosynthesis
MRIEHHPFAINRYSLAERPDWHVRMICTLYRLICARRIDVVVVNHTGNVSLIMIAARLARRPVIRFMRHSLAQLKIQRFRPLERLMLRQCAGLIYITQFIADETRAALPSAPPGIVLYNPEAPATGGSADDLEALRKEIGIPHGAPVVGVFGRIEWRKGQDVLVDACAHVVRRHDTLRLLIVGDCGDQKYGTTLHAAIHRHNLSRHVIFAGRRDDVHRLMSLCSLVVMPSRAEALGRVLLEAWAVRRPVIGSDLEGIQEVVTQSGGGLLVPSEHPLALAQSIERLLDDAALRERLGDSGRRWLRQNCDPARYAERFADFLLQFVAPNHPPQTKVQELGAR